MVWDCVVGGVGRAVGAGCGLAGHAALCGDVHGVTMKEYNIDLYNPDPRTLPDPNHLPWTNVMRIALMLTNRATNAMLEIVSMEINNSITAREVFQGRSLDVMREYADDLNYVSDVWRKTYHKIKEA
jgi:hypothetical protein